VANLIVSAVAEWNGKALKGAGKDVSAFDKGVAKLGRTIASVFAAQKIYQFGKASLKAFTEDQAAAVKLAKAVDNLGLSYSNPDITNFIRNLETQSGVIDDKLRPSFQALLTTTGDVTKAQDLLTSAIDISRGSGLDLATVSQDLANGYVGITRGLKKYNLGLTAAQLKSKSFEEIMVLLNAQFAGASAAYLSTYAGKMEVLTTAADNAKETIGKGLVDAVTLLAGEDGNVQNLADSMQNLATNSSNALYGVAALVAKFKQLPGNGLGIPAIIKEIASAVATPYRDLANLGAKTKMQNSGYGSGTGTVADYQFSQKAKQAAIAKAKADAKAVAIQKSLNKTTAKTAAISKQSAMTDKQKLLFNQTAISAVAALKGKLSDEERKKVELMLALEMDNVDAAAQLSQQVAMAYDESGKLALFLRTLPDAKNPFGAWNDYLNGIAVKANAIVINPFNISGPMADLYVPSTPQIPTPTLPTPGSTFTNSDFATLAGQGAGASGGFSSVVAAAMNGGATTGISQTFNTTINNPIGNGITDMVQQAILDAGRLGNNLLPAGSL
jgi:hypothetical protein